MSRECPRCHVKLEIVYDKDIELDECSQCGGLWFDPNELNKIIGGEKSVEGMIFVSNKLGEQLRCPDCNIPMEYCTVEGVTVDICQECEGIWLDYGELELLKAKMPQGKITPETAPYKVEGQPDSSRMVLFKKIFMPLKKK